MSWTLAQLQANRAVILVIAARRGVRAVRVFGSVARGEADAASDVDFLVDLDAGRSLLDLGGFAADLQDVLDCRVDVVTERSLPARFRDRVAKEAVTL